VTKTLGAGHNRRRGAISIPVSYDPPLDVARLLAERVWLERLARRLVRDPAAAEDLAQETLRRALEQVEPTTHLRGWLASVLRRLGLERARSERRRSERERSVARREATDPEVIERAALRRDVVDLLLGLDEPGRSAVVLRYLEDVEYDEIAARQGVSPAAARKRVSRGIERLRARLDERAGGRGAWALLAAPWIDAAAPSAAPRLDTVAPSATPSAPLPQLALPTLAMKLSTQVACALAVLAVVGATLRSGERASSESLVGRAQDTDASDSDSVESLVDVAPASAERAPIDSSPPAEAAKDPVALDAFPARPASTVGALELRVRWSDGSPAVGVSAKLCAWDDHAPWLNVRSVCTDAAGRALVEQLAPGRVAVSLDRGGSAPLAEILAGRLTVLEFKVPLGFEVHGRVLDPNGRPVSGAELVLSAYANDGDTMIVGRSGGDGRYEIRDVGEVRSLSARAAGFAPALSVQLEQRKPGQLLELDLSLRAGSAVLAGIVVGASGTPLRGARVSVKPAQEAAAASQRSLPRLELRSDEAGRFTVHGAGAGAVLLEVRSEVHAPWSEQIELAVDGRTDVVVQLREGATLTGTVVRSDGAQALGASVYVANLGDWSSITGFSASVDATGRYFIRGLPDGRLELNALEDGYGRATRSVVVVEGERSLWDARLVVERTVTGRVVDERGGPLAGWMVGTQFQANVWDRSTHSDAEGGFELRDVRPDADVVHVTIAWGYRVGSVASAPLVAGELLVQVPDAAFPNCSLSVRVLREGRAPEPAASVGIYNPESGGFQSTFTDAAGNVELTALRPGLTIVTLTADGAAQVKQRVELVAGERLDLGTLDLLPGGRIALHVSLAGGLELGARVAHAQVRSLDGDPAGRVELLAGVGTSERLRPGGYVLSIVGVGLESVERSCTVVEGETTDVEVALQLTGHALIELRADGVETGERSLRWSATASDGRVLPGAADRQVQFRAGVALLYLTGLPLGVSTVRVELSDVRAGEVVVEVGQVGPAAERVHVVLLLE